MRPPFGASRYMGHAFVVRTYLATNSFKRCPSEFRKKHGARDVPSKNAIHKMEGTLETTGSLIPSHGGGGLKISQDTIDDVKHCLQKLPIKPLRCLAQETGSHSQIDCRARSAENLSYRRSSRSSQEDIF
ncbi:hypothetical protein MHYP_G00088510 [Metynnis hypsauchen]